MRVAVIGATGLIGTNVVRQLEAEGHDVVAASRASGVDVVSGKGVAEALAGARVLVDVVNAPSFDDAPVLAFFSAASRHLLAAAKEIDHYVALSIVGVDRLPESGYMRAKVVQERAIVRSGLPFTIVRATQFHEFTEAITSSLTVGDEVRATDALIQPVSAAEVFAEVARVATVAPARGVVEIGGPEKMSFADMARAVVAARGLGKRVRVDADATYFGAHVEQTSLVTGESAALGAVRLGDWLERR